MDNDDDVKLVLDVAGLVDEVDLDDEQEDDYVENNQQIEEMALNSNFDPGLLDCWADEEEEEAAAVTTTITHATASSLISCSLKESSNNSSAGGHSISKTNQHEQEHRVETAAMTITTSNNHNNHLRLGDASWDEFDKGQQSLFLTGTAVSANCSSSSRPLSLAGNDLQTLPPFETTATGGALATLQQRHHHHYQHAVTGSASTLLNHSPQEQQHHHHHQQQQHYYQPSDPNAALTQLFAAAGAAVQQHHQQQHQPASPTLPPTFRFSPDMIPLAYNAFAAGVDLSSFFNPGGGSTAFNHKNNNYGTAAAVASVPSPPPPSSGQVPYDATIHAEQQGPPPQLKAPPTAAAAAAAAGQSNRRRGGKRDSREKRAPSDGGVARKGKGRVGGAKQGHQKQQQQSSQQEDDDAEEDPPFMLFDAPVELRHNFMQSQRAHGLPVLDDNNNFHFSRASVSTSGTASASAMRTFLPPAASPTPRLADARHGEDVTGKRIKNAKEQKRAQRITELIEQLRVRMEKGGWKVGIKSKLHTLSTCSDYVKHLVKVTKEKEAAVEQARSDLEAKRRKIEEEKAQQDPSEPESTTSSLTISSECRSANKKGNVQDEQLDKNDTTAANLNKTDDETNHNQTASDLATAAKIEATSEADSKHFEQCTGKKRKLSSHESNNSEYPSSVDNDDNGSKKRRTDGLGQHVSIGPVSSVSDITDNNKYSKGSSAATSSSDEITMSAAAPPAAAKGNNTAEQGVGVDGENDPASKDTPEAGLSAQNTVCSDAAVAETLGPDKDHSHGDSSNSRDTNNRDPGMAIQTITTTTKNTSSHHHHRKRKHQQGLSKGGVKAARDPTSIESSFRLDYEEVFLRSNVPQIIASTTGRIVAFNDIFLRATCLKRSQVDRLTIFSLVQTGMLSNLFELVAASLRENDRLEGERKTKETATQLQDYSTMTLPCVSFNIDRPPLFMTITLMTDEDVKKRCFHCIFTDCLPGAKGSVGSVTPQLLATLFQPVGTIPQGPSRCDGCRGGSSENGTKGGSESGTKSSSLTES